MNWMWWKVNYLSLRRLLDPRKRFITRFANLDLINNAIIFMSFPVQNCVIILINLFFGNLVAYPAHFHLSVLHFLFSSSTCNLHHISSNLFPSIFLWTDLKFFSTLLFKVIISAPYVRAGRIIMVNTFL